MKACEPNLPIHESLDSRQLRAFVVLARTGSFTETARELHLTHSAISHTIRSLEESVGCRLLNKSNKKNQLTEAGEALLPYALRALEEMRQARTTLTALNQWGSRRLRLAVDTFFTTGFLAPVLIQLHQDFPKLLLQVETGAVGGPALLENNQADIVLTQKPPPCESVEFTPLLTDHFHLVVNPQHPLASLKSVPRAELGRHPCFLLRRSGRERKQLEEFLARYDIALSIAGETDSLDTIKEFLRRTPAMSFLPGWGVARELKGRSLVSLPLGRIALTDSWGALHLRKRPLNLVESSLLKLCRQRMAEWQP